MPCKLAKFSAFPRAETNGGKPKASINLSVEAIRKLAVAAAVRSPPPFVCPAPLSFPRLSRAHHLFDPAPAPSPPPSSIPPMATATTSVAPPTTSTSSVLLHRRLPCPSPAPAPASAAFARLPRPPPRRARLLLQVALTNEVASDDVAAEEAAAAPKIGRRVRVTAPLRVYHVLKAPDLDMQGMEGVVKQYVCVWKGKRITANLPFKVEFQLAVEGQPKPVRFFTHLREDEFEFVDEE